MGQVISNYDQIGRLVGTATANQGIARNYANTAWELTALARYADMHTGFITGSGNRYKPDWINYNGSSGTVTTGRLYALPMLIPHACTVATVGIHQTGNGSAGTVHRLGIYASNGGGLPGALLVDGGTIAADTGGSAIRAITINYAFTAARLIWLVCATNSGGTFNRCGTQNLGPGIYNGTVSVLQPYLTFDPTTSMPSTFSVSGFIDPNSVIPRLDVTIS